MSTAKKARAGRHKAARRAKHLSPGPHAVMTAELFTQLALRTIKKYGPALKDLANR